MQCRQQGAARYCIFATTLSSLLQACSFKIPRQHPVSGEQKPGQAGWAQLVKEKSRSLVLWPGFLRRPEAWLRLREGTGEDGRGQEGTRASQQAAALAGPWPGSPTPARPGGGSGRCAGTQWHYLGPAAAAETRASCPCPAAQTVRLALAAPQGRDGSENFFPGNCRRCSAAVHCAHPTPGRSTVPVA